MYRCKTICIIIAGLLLILTTSQIAIADNNWYMFRHDPQHSGHTTSQAPDYKYLLWMERAGDYVRSSPAVVDGWVYMGSHGGVDVSETWGRINCFNSETGEKKWEYNTDNWVFSSPTVVNNRVYCGCNDFKLYCLDAVTGNYLWDYQAGHWIVSSPTVFNGRVYFGSLDTNIHCIDADDGSFIWSYDTGRAIHSSPAVVNDRLYIGSSDGKLYCLDAVTGGFIWSKSLGNIHSSPTVFDNKIYVCSIHLDPSDDSYYGILHCINTLTEEQIWSKRIGYVTSSPAIYNNRVYIGSYDWKVYCFNANNGNQIWDYKTNGKITHSSPAIADGKIYIGADLDVYCLDVSDGSYLWSYTTDWSVYASPTVANGKVYVGSEDGNLYCFSNPPSTPPNRPEIIGQTNGEPGVEYEYMISAIDPDGDDIYFIIDWGDNQKETLGPYPSGELIKKTHQWDNKNTYTITVSAKDTHGAEGYVSRLDVKMSKNKAVFSNIFLQIFLERHPIIYQLLNYLLDKN